jgi:NAD(P)-dependent dehydrogenase (short-subunit alcohol dehydrogenase family)
MNSIVVTGVSTGIGWGCTEVLISKGFHVFGSARKQADADRLVTEFGDEHFTPLLFDVTDEGAVNSGADIVRTRLNGGVLAGLVNNAGMAKAGPLIYQSVEDFRAQIDVNLIGAFIVTKAFAPLLGADRSLSGKPGRIVNISSVSGQTGAPFLGGYSASKHALEGFSESLRRELMLFGIDVIIIGPGHVSTPIWDKAESEDMTVYERTEYAVPLDNLRKYTLSLGRKGVAPEAVGQLVYHALTTPRPKTRYPILHHSFINWTLPMLLPKRLLDRIIARKLGLRQTRSS